MFKIKFYKYLLLLFSAIAFCNFAFADTLTPDGKAMPWIPLLLLEDAGNTLKGMDLIEDDYQKQVINYESYLIYKTQYIFGDPALPEKYQDQTLTPDASLFFNDIATVFYTLSEDCRQTLTPYFLRPDNPNSYINQTIVSRHTPQMTKSSVKLTDIQLTEPSPFDFEPFKYIDTSDGYLRIWHHYIPDDPQNNKWKQQAQELASDLDAEAYDRFYNLLGKHPPYDLDLGGNERIDLYLMDPQVMEILAWRSRNIGDYAGINLSQADNLFNTGSFSIIKTKLTRTEPDFTREQLRGIAAHEMFHMFQRSFIYHWREWWTEATATFAMQLVYPDDDIERWTIHSFIDYPAITLTSMKNKHQYGAYFFPFFLAKSFGEPFFASIFKENDGKSPIISTIENKLGSLDDAWKEFVLWNTMPNEHYGEEKPFAVNQTFAGHPNNRNVIFSPGRITVDIPALEPLSVYLIDVLLENDNFNQVSFSNMTDFRILGTHTAIQALIYNTPEHEIPSGWEDWSDLDRRDYILTNSSDRINKVLILFSNADPKRKTSKSYLTIVTKDEEEDCPAGPETVIWKGREWQRCDTGIQYINEYQKAESYCSNLNLGGHSDWRLPTIDELKSLVVCTNGTPTPIQCEVNYASSCHPQSCGDGNSVPFKSPTIDQSFSNCRSGQYLSSTTYPYPEYFCKYVVYFYNGGFGGRCAPHGYARCIRDK